MNDAGASFKECALLVLKHMGMGEPPPQYLEDLYQLQLAGNAWHREHGARLGFLHFAFPESVLEGSALITGDLCNAISAGWCGNEAARHFVDYIDERTGRKCTLLQLQVLMVLQRLVNKSPPVNAPGGGVA